MHWGDQLETGAAIALSAIIIAFLVARAVTRANPFKLRQESLCDWTDSEWPAVPRVDVPSPDHSAGDTL